MTDSELIVSGNHAIVSGTRKISGEIHDLISYLVQMNEYLTHFVIEADERGGVEMRFEHPRAMRVVNIDLRKGAE